MPPELSIIIPLHNRAHMIGRTLRSIPVDDAALAGGVEIIVVDDGSSDGGAEAAEIIAAEAGLSPILTVLRQANAGPGAARNAGAARATGALLAFLDSDDLWRSGTLDAVRQLARRADDMALGFLRSRDVIWEQDTDRSAGDGDGVGLARLDGFLDITALPETGSRFAACNMVIPRAVFMAAGGFTDKVRCSEDTDLFLRLADKGACWITEGPVLVAHVTASEDRLSRNGPCVRQGLAHLLDAAHRGTYPDPGRRLGRFLAGAIAYACRVSFAAGETRAAYRLLLRHGWRLWRGGQGRWVWRLALYPLLGRLRPESYPVGRAPGV